MFKELLYEFDDDFFSSLKFKSSVVNNDDRSSSRPRILLNRVTDSSSYIPKPYKPLNIIDSSPSSAPSYQRLDTKLPSSKNISLLNKRDMELSNHLRSMTRLRSDAERRIKLNKTSITRINNLNKKLYSK